MARLVVLSIEDNAQAETLVEDWNEARLRAPRREDDTLEPVRLFTPVQENGVAFEVVGIYAQPTLFCTPEDGHQGRKTQAGWTRGKKYGWWVCGACKKPARLWGRSHQAVVGGARNLLKAMICKHENKVPTARETHVMCKDCLTLFEVEQTETQS